MKPNPLISICIATYKRPDHLKSTLKSILNQTYRNFEIIVADNDTAMSAKKIVRSFNSKKITYISQKENVGMMKNFKTAFEYSHGDFIVFTADDDPLEPKHLEILTDLQKKHPDAGSYFGAPFVITRDPIVVSIHNLKKGKNSMRNTRLKNGLVRVYSPSDFFVAFLRHEIFGYFLWSCGMVRREIVEKKGLVEFRGAGYLTDFAYVLRAGLQAPVATINIELGSQLIHGGNFGRSNSDLSNLNYAVDGFYKMFKSHAQKTNTQHDLENFLKGWIRGLLSGVLKFRLAKNLAVNRPFLVDTYLKLAKDKKFLRRGVTSLYFHLYFPKEAGYYDKYKWVLEKRTFRRAFEKILLRR